MNGMDMSRRDDLEQLRQRLAMREENRAKAADKKRKDLEELRWRMEARAARSEGKTAADSNVEELRRRLAARRAAEARGIKYDDGRGNGHGGYRERRHGSGRNAYPSLAYAYAYRCVPVLACLLVFAISLGMFRTAVSGSAGAVRDDRYAAIRAQWLAENVVDVKDPPAEPEAAPLPETGEEMPGAVPVLMLAEPGPVQGPMPAYGPAWEPQPEEEPVIVEQEVRQEAAVQPAQDTWPAAQAQEREAPQEDADTEGLLPEPVLPEDGAALPVDETTFLPEPVLPEEEAVIPADGMQFVLVPVLPEDGAVIPVDEMQQEDTGDGMLPPEPVLPEDEAVLPVDEMLLQLMSGSDNPCNYGAIWP